MLLTKWGVKLLKQFLEELQYNKHPKINLNLILYGSLQMFILTLIAINSSLTSKWAHECSLIVREISSGFLRFPKRFLLLEFSSVREKKKGL